MSEKSGMKKLLDILGGFAAFLTVAVYSLLVIDANWSFLPDNIYNILAVCKTWAPLVVVAITGLEFTRGKNILIKLIFYILLAVSVVSMFFRGTWDQFVGLINERI